MYGSALETQHFGNYGLARGVRGRADETVAVVADDGVAVVADDGVAVVADADADA